MSEDFNVNDADRRAHELARLRVTYRYGLVTLVVLLATCAYALPQCGATPAQVTKKAKEAQKAGYLEGVADECRRWTP